MQNISANRPKGTVCAVFNIHSVLCTLHNLSYTSSYKMSHLYPVFIASVQRHAEVDGCIRRTQIPRQVGKLRQLLLGGMLQSTFGSQPQSAIAKPKIGQRGLALGNCMVLGCKKRLQIIGFAQFQRRFCHRDADSVVLAAIFGHALVQIPRLLMRTVLNQILQILACKCHVRVRARQGKATALS